MGLQRFIQTMRAIQGALIVASSIQIILGYSQVWGLFSRYGDTRKCKINLSSYFVIDWFSTIRVILQVFQSTWHGTCSWIGWLGIVWTGFSCGKFFYERQFIIPLGWPPGELICHVVCFSFGAAFLFLENHETFVHLFLEYPTILEFYLKKTPLSTSAYCKPFAIGHFHSQWILCIPYFPAESLPL